MDVNSIKYASDWSNSVNDGDAESREKMDEASIKYLSNYIELTDELKQKIEEHAAEYMIKPEVCSYYKDYEDYESDWASLNYSKEEIKDLLSNYPGEFMILPNDLGIIRFTV